jgi:hypothetical protein
MSEIQRICVQCGQTNPLDARFCARCGYDTQGALPAQRASLPAVVGRAALPVLVGAASLAVRAGWRLLQSRLAQPAPRAEVQLPATQQDQAIPLPSRSEMSTARPARRSIRIRSTWAMGDANGVWRQGSSEHIIEIDE